MKLEINGWSPGLRTGLHLPVLLLIFFSVNGLCASEDDYLKALEAESKKIGGGGKVVAGTQKNADKSIVAAQRVAFETYLQTKHKGTYAFYRKLPSRSQEEIFKAFLSDLPMEEVRHMVIDRKMNR